MAKILSRQVSSSAIAAFLLLCLCIMGLSQTPDTAPKGARGVIRLRVIVKVKGTALKLQRTRFYLIKGDMEQNKALFASQQERNKILLANHADTISRDCFYRSKGASAKLIDWLKKYNCESVYCREVEAEYVDGPNAVPEFKTAVDAGEKEFGGRELARKWLAVKLKEDLRSGFYKKQQEEIQAFLKRAEARGKELDPEYQIISVMTDRIGNAYFTDVKPGKYVITNVVPIEAGESVEVWNVEVTVAEGDLITNEKVITIANYPDPAIGKDPVKDAAKLKNQMSVESPLPVCSK